MKPILGFVKFAVACAVICALAGYAQPPETHGIAVENMDRSVKPGDDFYHFCNGEWIKRTSELIEEIAKSNAAPWSGPRKVADLYNSYMDEAAIEAKGLAPLRPHLEAIAAIRDKKELALALGETLRADVDALKEFRPER